MLIPVIRESDKKPITELTKQKALIHKDCVYLFNPFTLCVSDYNIFANGFSYSVFKFDIETLIKRANFIYLSKGAREITGDEFTAFTNQITALQEQSHLIKPLAPFEDFVESIRLGYGLQFGKNINEPFGK